MDKPAIFSRTAKTILATAALCVALTCQANSLDVQFLTDPQWLANHRDDTHVVVLDLRPEQEYQTNHIEGAVNVPIESLFVRDNGKHLIAPLPQIQRAFSAAGIDDDILVVIYDAGEFLNSARAFWVLEVYGHSRVVVLDGGLAAWMQLQLPIANTATNPTPRVFVPRVTPNRLATKLSTRLAVDQPGTVIIDARDNPDYRGEKSIAQRFGHIRSATNLPAKLEFDEVNGIKHLKPIEELRERYSTIEASKRVITYCNIGLMSATTYFILRRLGHDVANYDGSWIEWGNDAALPITGPVQSPGPAPTPVTDAM